MGTQIEKPSAYAMAQPSQGVPYSGRVGASGTICGLIGAAVVVLFRHRHVYHVRNKEIGLVLAGWAAYTIFIGAITPMIDNWAHFGGLLGGAVVAVGMRPRVAREG